MLENAGEAIANYAILVPPSRGNYSERRVQRTRPTQCSGDAFDVDQVQHPVDIAISGAQR